MRAAPGPAAFATAALLAVSGCAGTGGETAPAQAPDGTPTSAAAPRPERTGVKTLTRVQAPAAFPVWAATSPEEYVENSLQLILAVDPLVEQTAPRYTVIAGTVGPCTEVAAKALDFPWVVNGCPEDHLLMVGGDALAQEAERSPEGAAAFGAILMGVWTLQQLYTREPGDISFPTMFCQSGMVVALLRQRGLIDEAQTAAVRDYLQRAGDILGHDDAITAFDEHAAADPATPTSC